jgi:hypothetical protein
MHAQRSAIRARRFSLGLLLLPPLLLLPALAGFPYASAQAAYSDLAISHYPNAVYLLRALAAWGTLPLWSPAILSGAPFAANPLSGLWYPPGWLALLLPLPLGFNLLVMAHLLWGGLGMYRLLRAGGLAHPAALLGGLAFEALPKLFAHYGAGHLSLVYAVAWTPWLFVCQVARFPFHDRRFTISFPPGAILAVIFLADPRWVFYAGALWWGYASAHSQKGQFLETFAGLLGQSALAALLAAPLALPLLEYTRLSTRAHLTAGEALAFSLPASRLLGLVFPDLGGNHEWTAYPGGLVLALAATAVLSPGSRPGWKFWAWAALAALLFSLGEQIPGLAWLAKLPGLDLLRVPPRALFISGLALAALAAHGCERVLAGGTGACLARPGLVALAGFGAALTAGFWALTGSLTLRFAWGALALLAGGLWVQAALRRTEQAALRWAGRPASLVWVAGAFVLLLADLGGVGARSFTARPVDQVLAEGQAAARFLATRPGLFRVYSPSYSLPQHTAARYGLELADGVDPLQLEAYADYMEEASGVKRRGYSVTLPPFASGSPGADNRRARPDTALLGRLNVKYLVAEYELPVEGLALVARFGETRVYENRLAMPRAWVSPQAPAHGPAGPTRPATIVAWAPNRVVVEAEGPGVLALAELAYPGWRVEVDGQAGEMRILEGLLRGVNIGPGRHRAVFLFRPRSLYAGLILFACGLLGGVAGLFRNKRDVRTGP